MAEAALDDTAAEAARPPAPRRATAIVPERSVAGRTLVNTGLYYRQKDWSVRLQINNVLDKDYIAAAGSRTAVVSGLPRESRLSFTYNF